MAMRPGALLTREDLEGMPDDGRRYELVGEQFTSALFDEVGFDVSDLLDPDGTA